VDLRSETETDLFRDHLFLNEQTEKPRRSDFTASHTTQISSAPKINEELKKQLESWITQRS